jgi:hypothetical protein
MNLNHWLDHPLPSALIRSWAVAAGFTSEWPKEPRKVHNRALPAHEPQESPGEAGRAPFDDVQ